MGLLRNLKIALKTLASLPPSAAIRLFELARLPPEELSALRTLAVREADRPERIQEERDLLEHYKDACSQYHLWYYNTKVWEKTRFLGHSALKSVSDLWNYQEILFELKPQIILEFGACAGGGSLFFSKTLQSISPRSKVLSVDITLSAVAPELKFYPHIEFMECSSTDSRVAERIKTLRTEFPGPIFAILDSDHSMNHVLAELKSLRPLTRPGDYVVVEDSNINGHPVLPNWGPGPYEAIQAYFQEFPDDYEHDQDRAEKFGFSFATNGFLIRK